MAYRDVVLADRPIAYFPLGDRTGSTALDVSGWAHDGTINTPGTNVILGVPGGVSDGSTAMSFQNSTSGFISAAVAVAALAKQSYELWIVSTAQTANAMLISPRDATSNGVEVQINNPASSGNVAFINNAASGFAFSSTSAGGLGGTVTNGRPHHVVCTADGSTARIYIDGMQQNTAADNAARTPANTTTYIGKNGRDNTIPYSGSMHHVAVYNYTLSPSQILAHYRAGRAAPAARLHARR